MAIRDSDDRGPGPDDPAKSWSVTQVSIHDAWLAARLAEGLGLDGWKVNWSGSVDGSWEAFVGSPSMAAPAGARGRTRVSAITGAYLAAIRRESNPEPARPFEIHGKMSEFLEMNKLFDLA